MSKQVRMEVIELTKEALVPFGYRQRSASIFTRELTEETLARISPLMTDDWGRSPVVWVRPGIGVRHHQIETIFDDIVGEVWRKRGWKPTRYGPTLGTSVGSLTPERRNRDWEFEEGRDHAPIIRDMVAAIVTYGHPFLEAHASLPAIIEALQDPQNRYATAGSASLRLPIAYYLLGDYARAKRLLDAPALVDEPEFTAKFRAWIEQAIQGIRPERVARRPARAKPASEPRVMPPEEAPPLEIRHRETSALLLRLGGGIQYRANLRGVDLRGADLSGVIALGTDFRKANLAGALLDRAEFTGVDLRDADLSGASLRATKIDTANAHRLNLTGADLREALLERCLLHRANLTDVDLRHATLSQVELFRANLRRADLREAKCPDSYFYGADLREARLEKVELGRGRVIGQSRYDAKTRWPEGFDPEAHGATSEATGPDILQFD